LYFCKEYEFGSSFWSEVGLIQHQQMIGNFDKHTCGNQTNFYFQMQASSKQELQLPASTSTLAQNG
jgi:hypothetical protein